MAINMPALLQNPESETLWKGGLILLVTLTLVRMTRDWRKVRLALHLLQSQKLNLSSCHRYPLVEARIYRSCRL